LELGQVALVIAILILLFILLKLFRVNRKDWILFVSSGVFALALKMTLERLPFNISFFDLAAIPRSVPAIFAFQKSSQKNELHSARAAINSVF
jgi:hypothetical protein